MKKQVIIIIVLGLTFVAFVVLFSFYQTSKVQKELKSITPPEEEEEEGQAVIMPQQSRITPARPEDYGMVVVNEANKPKTQEEWDSFFSKMYKGLKAQTPAETWNKIQEKIEKDPAKRAESLKKLNEKIAKCKGILKENAEDKETQERLEHLMMLKSIAKELPDE